MEIFSRLTFSSLRWHVQRKKKWHELLAENTRNVIQKGDNSLLSVRLDVEKPIRNQMVDGLLDSELGNIDAIYLQL